MEALILTAVGAVCFIAGALITFALYGIADGHFED